LKTCQKAEARTTTKDILQTNNKNPILHLITRSVKQKIQQKEEEKKWKEEEEKRAEINFGSNACCRTKHASIPFVPFSLFPSQLSLLEDQGSRLKTQGDSSILLNLLHFLR